MFKVLVLGLFLVTEIAYSREVIWECALNGGTVTLSTSTIPPVGHFRIPILSQAQDLEYQFNDSLPGKAKVIFEKIGAVTKHATMATYLLELSQEEFQNNGPAQVLRLNLLGIDEVDRQKCDVVVR